MNSAHSFHIPVMGIGFTVDTPLKVAHYGIDSVIFISDDSLLERLRAMYCKKFKLPYNEISTKAEDSRAERITSYLNLIRELAREKFENLVTASGELSKEVREYFGFLPDNSVLKHEFNQLTSNGFNLDDVRKWLRDNLTMGSIDVNIMTKLDRENYKNNDPLPVEFNDAHSALRGYAKSELTSSIVFSAGMNPRLFSYLEGFEDFYPNEEGEIKKKIILKVSDYRSALIQGKFLAKKGLWVSEFRIESGLNCGGHAFASDGHLMGPILREFRDNREELVQSLHDILIPALTNKNRVLPTKNLPLRITAQGGVGTAEEHRFLLDHYKLDSVGWGTPFLLVPDATSVDGETMKKLVKAKEKDLYLSDISPLGVPFNNLRGNTKDLEKLSFIAKGRPGSSCPKKHLSINTEFTEQSICTASRQYQRLKIKELEGKELTEREHDNAYKKIVEKSCLCVGLASSALVVNEIDRKKEGDGILICPGPNMAYFSKVVSLKEMIGHIYGRNNVIERNDRPNMFVKELSLYIDYLDKKVQDLHVDSTAKEFKTLKAFTENLIGGIDYYSHLFSDVKITEALNSEKRRLDELMVGL